MTTLEWARDFAGRWIADWNSHDLDAILGHYAAHAEFNSPVAARLVGQGHLTGLAALRDYWTRGLALNPGLRFELRDVLAGEACATLLYLNDRDQLVAETMAFDADGRIVRASACYSAPGRSRLLTM